jgi:hypothetical protein
MLPLTFLTTLNNDSLIDLIVQFVWSNLFVLLTQFFCLALILRIVRLFID